MERYVASTPITTKGNSNGKPKIGKSPFFEFALAIIDDKIVVTDAKAMEPRITTNRY